MTEKEIETLTAEIRSIATKLEEVKAQQKALQEELNATFAAEEEIYRRRWGILKQKLLSVYNAEFLITYRIKAKYRSTGPEPLRYYNHIAGYYSSEQKAYDALKRATPFPPLRDYTCQWTRVQAIVASRMAVEEFQGLDQPATHWK